MTNEPESVALKSISVFQAARDLARALMARLERGELRPGDQMPSVRQLAGEMRVSRTVAHRAMRMLEEEGWVEMRRGSGTYVCEPDKKQTRRARSRTKRIGVILPPYGHDPEHHFAFGTMLHGICGEAQRHSHFIEIIASPLATITSWDFADRVFLSEVDGLIWAQPPYGNMASLVRIMAAGIPVVLTGRGFPEVPAPVVGTDPLGFGEAVADCMARQGRRDLVVMTGLIADRYTESMVNGARVALERRGLSLPEHNVITVSAQTLLHSVDLHDNLRRFLAAHPAFDAVLVIHNGFEALIELHESGRRTCPRDFIVLFPEQGGSPIRQVWPQIPINLIQPPMEAIGRQAVKTLEHLWGLEPSGPPEDLAPTLDEAR